MVVFELRLEPSNRPRWACGAWRGDARDSMFVRMHKLKIWILLSSLVLGVVACDGDQEDEPGDRTGSATSSRPIPLLIKQIAPPVDLKEPPADATKTASGLAYKKLSTRESNAAARGSDTVLVHYTGWRQRSGETFFTTKGRGQPITIDIAHAAPGFAEMLPLLHKGEKAVVWVPPTQSAPEPLVYEIEVVDIVAPPAVAKRTPKQASSTAAETHR